MITTTLFLLALALVCVSIYAIMRRKFGAALTTGLIALAFIVLMFSCDRPAKAAASAVIGGGNSYFFLQTGTNITAANGTVTNTFATPFSTNAAAVSNIQVFVCQMGVTNSTSNVVTSITASNFIYGAGTPNVQFSYLVIGPPQ